MLAGFVGQLRTLRLAAGLSQEELARRARVSVRAVRDIEHGRVRHPRPDSLRRLAVAVGLPGEEFAPTSLPLAEPFAVRVLGPLTVTVDSVPVNMGSTRQRLLLGLLALQANQVVPRGEIVDALWGDQPPDTCVNLVHTYVARLRRTIIHTQAEQPVGRILRTAGGYLLRIDPDRLDVLRFTDLMNQVRKHDGTGGGESDLHLLRQALALWRGTVLSDLDTRIQQHPAAVELTQRRIDAVLTLADLSRHLGQPELALPDLQAVAHTAQFHEGLHARLMLALAANGQQEAALRLHAELRARLRDQLGVEPAAEIQEAQIRILRQNLAAEGDGAGAGIRDRVTVGRDRASRAGAARSADVRLRRPPESDAVGSKPLAVLPPPAQLPSDVVTFTGREHALAHLDEVASGPRRTAIVAITGMAGVGKTALVVHWAHRNRHEFPDGQLYVNLRGYSSAAPLREIEALAGFLDALGIPPERVPNDPDQAAAMYRTLLADRRMLVVLDNAASPDQVRPLLPGSSGCQVFITSRERLNGMVAVDGVHRVDLDVLETEEAQRLLTRLLPEQAVRAEPAAVAELARACARLPLALRIAAANLADDPGQQISGHVARLHANRLAALEVDGDAHAAVRAAFDLSYDALAVPARRLFRLVGAAPVLDFGAPAAAALADADQLAVERLLGRLASAHLIQQHAPGRYAFHDLIRLYAVERAEAEDAGPDRSAALSRLYDWYQRHVDGAADLLYRHMLRLPGSRSGPAVEYADPPAALAWLDAERRNITAVAAYAAGHGPDTIAWSLVDGLRGYLWFRGYSIDLVAAARTARSAAERADDLPGQVSAELCLASAATRQSRYAEATTHATRMATLARLADWPEAEGAAYGTMGPIYWRSGRLSLAAEAYQRALAVYEGLGGARGVAPSLGNLGLVYLDQGLVAEAGDLSAEALVRYRELGETVGEAIALSALGRVHHLLGRHPEAIDQLTRALTMQREIGHRLGAETSLEWLAAVYLDVGDHARAMSLARDALVQSQETGDTWHEASARTVLADIHCRQGEYAEAVEQHTRAIELARRTGERSPEVTALAGLGTAHLGLDDPDRAREYAEEALGIARECGYRLVESAALLVVARICLGRGDLAGATAYAEQALAGYREVGYRLGEAEAFGVLGEAATNGARRDRCRREAATIRAEVGAGAS